MSNLIERLADLVMELRAVSKDGTPPPVIELHLSTIAQKARVVTHIRHELTVGTAARIGHNFQDPIIDSMSVMGVPVIFTVKGERQR